uniref:Thionin class 1 n=1 Tax=Tulipa gesneriana TaxID=13306 RepID=Q43224_TULGE|nr:thionin class 1 [Tulipa gesneriana]
MMVVVILGLVVAQTQVEAKSCCRTTAARNCYNVCRLGGTPQTLCARTCDCIHITTGNCPRSHPKLGSASSTSSTTNVDDEALDVVDEVLDVAKEAMKEAVERCNNACSEVCTKGSYAVVTA